MRDYIYKIIIFIVAIIIIFEFTLGRYLNNFNQQLDAFTSKEGRKEIVESLKKEIKKANEKENYLKHYTQIIFKII